MDGTITQQGSFTSDGTTKTIELRSGVDWMYVVNDTTTAAGGAGTGVEFRWFRGMADGYAREYQKLAADESMVPVIATTGGFTYVDTSDSPALGAVIASTGVTAAAIPLLTMAATAGVIDGGIVRIGNHPGALQFGGVDFEIGTVVANTSAQLVYGPQVVATIQAGQFRILNIPTAFYPRWRFISKITAANPGVVTTTVSHGYTVGQQVRLVIPDVFGMTQMDGLLATITAVSASTFTTDIDTSAFTAFAWPLTAGVPFTHAQVIPVGESASYDYVNLLDDATDNQGYIGMELPTGTDSPGGVANDVIRWIAGTSFNVDNE